METCSECGRIDDTDSMVYDKLNDLWICEECIEAEWLENQNQLDKIPTG